MSSNIFGYSTATNFSNRLPDTAALAKFVTLDTTQTITGQKTFTAPLSVGGLDATSLDTTGAITAFGTVQGGTLSSLSTAYVANTLYVGGNNTLVADATQQRVNVTGAFNVQKYNANRGDVLIAPDPGALNFNPIVQQYDSVITAKTVDNSFDLSALTLTANSQYLLGVRISSTDHSVKMRALDRYIEVTNTTNPKAVGAFMALDNNSTDIATTQWVQSLIATLAPTVSFFSTANAPSQTVYYTVPVVEGLGTNIVYLSIPSTSSLQLVYLKFPIPNGQFANKQVIIRLPDLVGGNLMNGNWYVTSTDLATPIFCAGITSVPVVTYNLNSYVAATWMCDGQYWYLLSRV